MKHRNIVWLLAMVIVVGFTFSTGPKTELLRHASNFRIMPFYTSSWGITSNSSQDQRGCVGHDVGSSLWGNKGEAVISLNRRRPVWNGTFSGEDDPNRWFPCFLGGEFPYRFNAGDDYKIYQSLPKEVLLPTHHDTGQYCFTGYQVSNVALKLIAGKNWKIVYTVAVHIPTGLFVPADVHFHDCLYRNMVNTDQFPAWRKKLVEETEPFRRNTTATFWSYYRSSEHPMKGTEGVYIPPGELPSTITKLPVETPYVHLLAVDIVGMMPAVSVAAFLSCWGHFYSSGIQALASRQVTVIVNNPLWGSDFGYKNGFLIETFLRFFPLPMLYIPANQTFFVKKLTFSPRGYLDVPEPCTFHFLHNYLVPVVTQRMFAALKKGREEFNSTIPKKDDGRNATTIAHGIEQRHPNSADMERPWWPREYDHLIRHPPEGVAILKTEAGMFNPFAKGRRFEITLAFKNFLCEANYTLITDTSPLDVRMYLINHAKRLLIQWGGGSTVHSHLWGGGIEARKKRYLDVIMLIHPGYRFEWLPYYQMPLMQGGVKLKSRNITKNGNDSSGGGKVVVFIGPPNPTNHWSEAAYSFPYAWTKMIRLDDLSKLGKEDVVISENEKERNYGPYCKDRLLTKLIGPRQRTKYEFFPP